VTVAIGGAAALVYKNFIQREAEDDVPDDDPNMTTLVTALTPDTQAAYAQLELLMFQRHGIRLRRGQTVRSEEQQRRLVETGASAALFSWHLVGRAIDAYPIDPATGQPDMEGRNIDLFRKMHVIWAELGGLGLAFSPYPEGPIRLITVKKNGVPKKIWDGGHLEFHGPFASAKQAWLALQSGAGGVA